MNDKIMYRIKSLEMSILRNILTSDMKMLTPSQMQIMWYILNNQDKEIYQKDLESVINSKRATVSSVLQTMERNGLIKRTISNKDTRTKVIVLNDSAKETYLKSLKKLENVEQLLIKNINPKDLEIFCHVLSIMEENINSINL